MGIRYGRLLNDFFHDIAAGFFPGAVAGTWLVQSRSQSGGAGLPGQALGGVWVLLVLGLLLSVITGIFRLRYHLDHVKPELVKARNDGAFLKHVAFVVMLAASGVVFGMLVL